MTFSLAAFDRKTGMFGIGVASSSIAVANRCPWARAGTGAVCTQHRTDIRCGPLGLDLLAQGFAAQEVVNILVAGSEYPAQRQFAVVDKNGRAAFYNGPGIESIATGAVGDACVSVGNFLANEGVTQAMVDAYEGTTGSFFERLLASVDAGVEAGGETQEAMAAGLLVVDKYSWPLVDLRVDFNQNPHVELRRLWRTYEPLVERFVTQVLRPFELKPLINSALTV